jgi:hypothetical protein
MFMDIKQLGWQNTSAPSAVRFADLGIFLIFYPGLTPGATKMPPSSMAH